MYIKSIKTRQFAGVKNKEVTLDNGLNVLVGNNETGKSTMIELIYQILYRSSNLNKKEDKDFFTRFMPSNNQGDVVDGTLVFTTADGEYTLQKKWGASKDCELVAPNGTIIASEDKIREIIASELIYKKGLYDDVVFASQKNQSNVVEHILKELDKKADAKRDLVSIIASEGMSSTGGIAPEDIEEKIREKINGYIGNWDFAIDLPKNRRGIDKPYKNGNGYIIKAYYELETLKDKLRKAETTEKAIDNDNSKILEAKKKLEDYKAEKEEYGHYDRFLAAYNSNRKLKEEYLSQKTNIESDLNDYPELLKTLDEALYLSTLANAKVVIEQFNKIQSAKAKLDESKAVLDGSIAVSSKDEENLATLDKSIDSLQTKLSNLNLVANIKKLGNTDIQVKSIVTGKEIDITSGEFDINETVEITVPGIMSLTIAAKGIDVEEIQGQLAEKTKERDELLSKFRVKDIGELREKKSNYERASHEFEAAEKDYNALVENVDLDKLESDLLRYNDKVVEIDNLDKNKEELCGSEPIDMFVARQEQKIKTIEEKYGEENPIDSMKERLSDVLNKLEPLKSLEDDAANIPEKYREIENVEAYNNMLDENIDSTEQNIKEFEDTLRAHEKELGDVDPDELRARIDDSAIEFQKLKDECKRWEHILAVLNITRDNMTGESTMSDVRDKFADYLSVISDGRIALQSMDDNMDVDIQSGDNHMTYDILSEGTKDTIALAFRLAMLKHLFPNGGGLVIFDDPFTEMDKNRTKQACELVQKFADEGNQVIFVTCDNKYKKLLSGNAIEM